MREERNAAGEVLAMVAGDLEAIAARVRAAVVEVRAPRHGAGAGTVWSADGVIVTNHHVAPGERVELRLADGRELHAAVAVRDVENDLAVFRVKASGLPAAAIGDVRKLRPGEVVLAVGHPFGVAGALTVGVLSAAHVQDGRRELVRADVRLAPGNSGGPLADARGHVVGINAMVNGGMALAVPSHLVQRLVDRARTGQRLLGVGVRDVLLSPTQAVSGVGSVRAALVTAIHAGGPADRAGILVGDVIVAVDGITADSAAALAHAVQSGTNSVVRLQVVRGNESRTIVVPLRDRTEQHAA